MTMNSTLKGVAKRLTFSLILLSALGGCAVYGPPSAVAYGTDAYGQPIYATPYYYPYDPYYYDPFYIGGPVFFDFGFRGHHDHDRDFRGGHGGGFRGGHGEGHGGGHR